MVIAAARFFAPGFVPTPEDERAFFSSLRLKNDVFKTTSHRRLDDLNQLMLDQWAAVGWRPRRFLDVGVSSAVSSVEWVETLLGAGLDVSMLATDLSLYASLQHPAPLYTVLVDGDEEPLQHAIMGIPIRPWRRRRDYLTGMALLSTTLNTLYRMVWSRRKSAGQRVTLVSRRVEGNAHLELAQEDLLAPPTSAASFDVVRAANILNREYFTEAQLKLAVSGLKQRLTGPGSYLAVNRTHEDATNHGTLFRLGDDNRFSCVARLGAGSEAEASILVV